jgi:hypothetical protein
LSDHLIGTVVISLGSCPDVVQFRIMSERQSVTFSDQAMAELRAEARRIGITVSDLVRRIVDQYREAKAK